MGRRPIRRTATLGLNRAFVNAARSLQGRTTYDKLSTAEFVVMVCDRTVIDSASLAAFAALRPPAVLISPFAYA